MFSRAALFAGRVASSKVRSLDLGCITARQTIPGAGKKTQSETPAPKKPSGEPHTDYGRITTKQIKPGRR